MHERVASLSRLVDSLLRGRAQLSARHEASAAVSDIRAFVRAWRPAAAVESNNVGGAVSEDSSSPSMSPSKSGNDADGADKITPSPPADALLKLAQVSTLCGNSD